MLITKNDISLGKVAEEKALDGLEALASTFLHDRLKETADMKLKIDQNNFIEIQRIAHNWKGFSLPYGFPLLGELAKELETAASSKSAEKLRLIIDNISYYLSLKEELISQSKSV